MRTCLAEQMEAYLAELEEKMREAARKFDFKQAAAFRDRLKELKNRVVLDAATVTLDMSLEDGMGLVCAGGVNQSFLARMPALLAHLGPIKASSLSRGASRSPTLCGPEKRPRTIPAGGLPGDLDIRSGGGSGPHPARHGGADSVPETRRFEEHGGAVRLRP